MAKKSTYTAQPLAQFITERLRALGFKQVDFCRRTGFDQGLLSKLQSSVITTVNLESALKLSAGLKVPPGQILSLLGKDDAHRLLKKLYGNNVCAECEQETITPEPVQAITTAAQQAFTLGRDMTPVLVMLRHLSATRRSAAAPEATATAATAVEHVAHGGHS